MEWFLALVKAFAVGGLFCVIAQILIDKTKLTPARILVSYVVAGVLLGAVGLYEPLLDFAGAGAATGVAGAVCATGAAAGMPATSCSSMRERRVRTDSTEVSRAGSQRRTRVISQTVRLTA